MKRLCFLYPNVEATRRTLAVERAGVGGEILKDEGHTIDFAGIEVHESVIPWATG